MKTNSFSKIEVVKIIIINAFSAVGALIANQLIKSEPIIMTAIGSILGCSLGILLTSMILTIRIPTLQMPKAKINLSLGIIINVVLTALFFLYFYNYSDLYLLTGESKSIPFDFAAVVVSALCSFAFSAIVSESVKGEFYLLWTALLLLTISFLFTWITFDPGFYDIEDGITFLSLWAVRPLMALFITIVMMFPSTLVLVLIYGGGIWIINKRRYGDAWP